MGRVQLLTDDAEKREVEREKNDQRAQIDDELMRVASKPGKRRSGGPVLSGFAYVSSG